ncbi:HAD-IA family hydrolase [Elioraea tepida]|jgi:phosphoglycolate phosphatase|uniref:HAD-IA family hydrolase n=1 Tax=Elioraea tepida TaxID=2843330 RepID=A0A975U2C3_9PROT|nr:HAD-IA family hydrolase [Elioraea tepida]QXM25070.1 HAD-IA family hydrolase [Elioraea tepida]
MRPPQPEAVLFDWDNTLVDAWPGIAHALNTALTRFGHPAWTLDEVRARVRKSLRDTFPSLFGRGWEEAREVFYEALEATHLTQLTPLPGAGETLAQARALGLPLAVVSNKTGRFLRREAEALGWSGAFAILVGAGDAEADKPDPAPFRLALGALGQSAGSSVWYVGDTALDMLAARNAGLTGILFGDAAHDGGPSASLHDWHAPDHASLQSLLATRVAA